MTMYDCPRLSFNQIGLLVSESVVGRALYAARQDTRCSRKDQKCHPLPATSSGMNSLGSVRSKENRALI